jgi:ribosomal protein L11 methyltransferase
VLAIGAGKLGWKPVTGYDHERAALAAARENAAANAVEVSLEHVNLRDGVPPLAGTVAANLTAPLLKTVASGLNGGDLPARLVCSGLLAREADDVRGAFEAAGLRAVEVRRSGDWAALCLRP